ncbi:MAG: hypothetical protein ACYCYI_13515 [Saccharofermentanales bacterium]
MKKNNIGFISVILSVLTFMSFFNVLKTEAVDTTILYVKDFGAIADGDTNCAEPVKNAITKAISLNKPVEIKLEEGEYRFNAATAQSAAILINNAKNLTISGVKGQTLFIIENPGIGTFLLNDCENITIRNITIDYDPLPFTQGTVVAFDMTDSTVDIDIDDGYTLPTEDFYIKAESRAGITANLDGDETMYGLSAIWTDDVLHVKDRIYRIKAKYPDQFGSNSFKKGDRFFYKSSRYTQAGVCAVRTKNISISDMTIYAGPSVATVWGMCDTVHINRLTVAIKPGSGRLLANNADGIHAFGTRNGMIVENSSFSGNGDDEVNIHSRAGYIEQIVSSTKIRVNNYGTSEYRVGDMIQIFDTKANMPRAEVKILSIANDTGKPTVQTITLDKPVTGIMAAETLSGADMVFNLSACGQGSVFRNNIFGIGAGRNMLIQSRGISILDNSFKSQDGWSICIYHDTNFGEGPQGTDITIDGNTFTGVGRGRIASIVIGMGGPKPGQRPFKNITIKNNEFLNPRNSIISANGADGLYIINNKAATKSDPALISGPAAPFPPTISIQNSNDVLIKDFTVIDPNPKINSVILIKADMDSGTTGVKIDNLMTKVSEFTTDITDERDAFGSRPANSYTYSRKNSSLPASSKSMQSSSGYSAGNNSVHSADSTSNESSSSEQGIVSQTVSKKTGSNEFSVSSSDGKNNRNIIKLILLALAISVLIAGGYFLKNNLRKK